MTRKPYTEEECALILACKHGKMKRLAKKLGRSYGAVHQKRAWLRRERYKPIPDCIKPTMEGVTDGALQGDYDMFNIRNCYHGKKFISEPTTDGRPYTITGEKPFIVTGDAINIISDVLPYVGVFLFGLLIGLVV